MLRMVPGDQMDGGGDERLCRAQSPFLGSNGEKSRFFGNVIV